MNGEGQERFSRRFGHAPDAAEITVREDAPSDLRYAVVSIAEELNVTPGTLRGILCKLLRTRPDPGNWSPYPNIWNEVEGLIDDCEWYKVYDAIEAIHAHLVNSPQPENAERYSEEINAFFREKGIGWQFVDGRIEMRGDDAFEGTVHTAVCGLEGANLATARTELREARLALSSRPEPDLSGAVFHAFAALESVTRQISGDEKATLGEQVKRHPELFPKPLDDVVGKAWGFASNEARHAREGRALDFADAQACVGLAATLCTYLLAKWTAPPA